MKGIMNRGFENGKWRNLGFKIENQKSGIWGQRDVGWANLGIYGNGRRVIENELSIWNRF
jgi:hypothetical protein